MKGKWGLKQWCVFVKFGIDKAEQLKRFEEVKKSAPGYKRQVSDYMKALKESSF